MVFYILRAPLNANRRGLDVPEDLHVAAGLLGAGADVRHELLEPPTPPRSPRKHHSNCGTRSTRGCARLGALDVPEDLHLAAGLLGLGADVRHELLKLPRPAVAGVEAEDLLPRSVRRPSRLRENLYGQYFGVYIRALCRFLPLVALGHRLSEKTVARQQC